MIKYLCVLFVVVIALPYCAWALTNGDFETSDIGIQPANWYKFSCDSFTTGSGARTGGSGTKIGQGYNSAGSGGIYQTETGVPTSPGVYPATWSVIGWVRLVDDTTNFAFGWQGTLSPYSPAGENITTPPALGVWTRMIVTHTWSAPSSYNEGWRDVQLNFRGHADLDDIIAFAGIPVSLVDFSAEVTRKGDWCFE